MSSASVSGPHPSRSPGGALWTAGAVARFLGVPPSTLRSWHRRYGIAATGHHAGRHRRYTDADIAALTRMKHLITDGMSPESAAQLAHHPVHPVASEAPATSPTERDGLLDAAFRLDADMVLAILEAHLLARGVIATWDELCCPALAALTRRAVPDSPDECIDVEHLLSWAITAALHRAPTPPAQPGPPVLLACADGEHHTLALEALRAALAQHAIPTRTLGAAAPTAALHDALRRAERPPAALVLWAHTPDTADPGALRSLADTGITLIAAGPGWDHIALPPKVTHPTNLRAALDSLRPPLRKSPAHPPKLTMTHDKPEGVDFQEPAPPE
ncbi:MAG: MerR family transcriptional regulator [Pseudonocardiaceae bacterium]